MDLLKIEKGAFKLDSDRVGLWRSLNPVEQYFTLMEAWLFLADDSMAGKFRYRTDSKQFEGILGFSHPACEDPLSSDEVTLAETRLPEKGVMTFHFDFGDDWEFSIKLEKIAPPEEYPKAPKLLKSLGKAPKQYTDYE